MPGRTSTDGLKAVDCLARSELKQLSMFLNPSVEGPWIICEICLLGREIDTGLSIGRGNTRLFQGRDRLLEGTGKGCSVDFPSRKI